MIPERGVSAGVLFDRLFEWSDRFLMLAELEQDPAQAVEVRPVIGFSGESLTNHLFGLLKVLPLIGPQITEIVVELSVLGIGVVDLFEDFLALSELTLLDVDVREAEVTYPLHEFVDLFVGDQLFKTGDGLIPLPRVAVDPRFVVQVPLVVRFELDRLTDRLDRALGVAVEYLRAGQQREEVGLLSRQLALVDGLFGNGNRITIPLGQHECLAQLKVQVGGTLFPKLDRVAIELDGIVGSFARLGDSGQ